MEAILFVIIIGWAVKKAAESGHLNWQGSKRANRRRTQGQPAGRRSAAALQHDTAYWAHEVTHGFPSARHGLVTGWHTGQQARYEGTAARAQARTDRLALRARVAAAVREQRRRQAEILEEIRATHDPDDPDPLVAGVPGPGKPAAPPDDPAAPRPTYSWGPAGSRLHWPAADREEAERWARHMSTDGHPKEVAEYPPGGGPGRVTATYSGGELVTSPAPGPSPTTTEGNSTMPASDTTYTQQMSEYTSLRRDAEEELNSATRKRMTSRLDILMSLGLDPASLAEAAAIDDALREQEKAARQALDATDAAIQGLSQRHGGIKAAVDDAPVDKPADAEFYAD